MECSTSYGSIRGGISQPDYTCRLPTARPKLLRKEKRASNLLRRAVVRAMNGGSGLLVM